MPKYLVVYSLTGSVEVEATNKEKAEDMVLGDGEFKDNLPMTDVELIDGLSRSFGYIDGDAIAIELVEELEGGR